MFLFLGTCCARYDARTLPFPRVRAAPPAQLPVPIDATSVAAIIGVTTAFAAYKQFYGALKQYRGLSDADGLAHFFGVTVYGTIY